MTLHRPTQRRISECLLVAATNTLCAGYAVIYVAYLVLLTVGGHW